MNAVVAEPEMGRVETRAASTSAKTKVLAVLEVGVVFAVIMAAIVA